MTTKLLLSGIEPPGEMERSRGVTRYLLVKPASTRRWKDDRTCIREPRPETTC